VTGTEISLELDCRGMACPRPVIELARAIAGVPPDARVAVLADDVAARSDIPAWCRLSGHEYAGETAADDGTPCYVVVRRA
jgi:tRNA 2-thiouridine synthesizing protein A